MDFGGVDIRIELNENSPYIIESSLPLQESGKGYTYYHWTACLMKIWFFQLIPKRK